MSEEVSRITDEHRAFIGKKAEPRAIVIDEADARRMRDVLGDDDPRYADSTGIAPPYVIALVDPARTGIGPSILPGRLLTGHEWTFLRPFRAGEPLTAVAQVTDIRDRLGGRYGYSVLVTTRVDFFDSDGNLVAASTAIGTQFDPKGRRDD